MTVAFASEYFPPSALGGAEWSTYFLAKNLTKQKVKIVVVTPNLGASPVERTDGFKVIRFPFYLKSKFPGNFAFTNPIWIIWAAFNYYHIFKKEKIDIIHIQGKYSIIPVILANSILKKPVLATIRDYYPLCNYGMCLMRGNRACNFWEYWTEDFPKYYSTYVSDKSIINLIKNLLFACWGRLSTRMIKFYINRLGKLTAMSFKQKQILVDNGIKPDIEVVRNSFEFRKNDKNVKRKNQILFVGRLTKGKGVGLILKMIPTVKKVMPNYKFLFAGSGALKRELELSASKNGNIVLLGQLENRELDKYYQQSKLVLVPSLWPEPFARVVIEAISFGTPVVVSNSGGLPEFIKSGQYGFVSENSSRDLAEKITLALKYDRRLRANITKDLKSIEKRFTTGVALDNLRIYKQMLGRKR